MSKMEVSKHCCRLRSWFSIFLFMSILFFIKAQENHLDDIFDLDADLPDDFDLSEVAFQTVKHDPFSYYKKYLTNSTDSSFSYNPISDRSPRNWQRKFPQCGGDRQSPINLMLYTCMSKSLPRPLRMMNADKRPENVTMENNGYSVEITSEYDGERPVLFGGPLKSAYVYEGMHFHWGLRDTEGSEHSINSRSSALEMHLVHRNSKYDKLSEAAKYKDGIVVIGVLFEVSKFYQEMQFLKNLDQLRLVRSSVSIRGFPQGFRLVDFVGNLKEEFIAYQGSLTTPPCAEAVSWLVMKNPRKISWKDMNQFRRILGIEGTLLAPNFRPLNPRNERFCLIF